MEPAEVPALDRSKVAAGRLWAAAAMPYLASALFATTVTAAPSSGTIATDDSWGLRADPEIIDRLDAPELGRLFLHLLGHLIRDHAGRAGAAGIGAADAEQWNRCADAEINDDLDRVGCRPGQAPEVPADLRCAEAGIAEAYLREATLGPRQWDCGSGADGVARPWDRAGGTRGLTLEQAENVRLSLAAEIQRCHRNEPGSVPGGWVRWAEAVLPSRIHWKRVFGAEIRGALRAGAGRVDYSYRRPSRRQTYPPEVILPRLVQPVPAVAIVCDTSGSMSEPLLARALAEVDGILRGAGIRACPVLAVDTVVHSDGRVRRAAQVRLGGGGGTDMGAGIAAASLLRPRPSVIVVLTDGFTPWPARPPARTRVVVGLLAEHGPPPIREVPAWARAVVIEEPTA